MPIVNWSKWRNLLVITFIVLCFSMSLGMAHAAKNDKDKPDKDKPKKTPGLDVATLSVLAATGYAAYQYKKFRPPKA